MKITLTLLTMIVSIFFVYRCVAKLERKSVISKISLLSSVMSLLVSIYYFLELHGNLMNLPKNINLLKLGLSGYAWSVFSAVLALSLTEIDSKKQKVLWKIPVVASLAGMYLNINVVNLVIFAGFFLSFIIILNNRERLSLHFVRGSCLCLLSFGWIFLDLKQLEMVNILLVIGLFVNSPFFVSAQVSERLKRNSFE